MLNLELCAGSVTGKDHTFKHTVCQDAFYLIQREDRVVGVACDGCGSTRHADVGAKLGARIACEWLSRTQGYLAHPNLNTLTNILLHNVDMACSYMCGQLHFQANTPEEKDRYAAVLCDYFLFSMVGFIIDPEKAHFFYCGDGTLIVNGQSYVDEMRPCAGNAPPYLAYRLLGQEGVNLPIDQCRLKYLVSVPTAELESFLIGSDGCQEIDKFGGQVMPNQKEFAGPLSQFWMNDKFFKNPVLAQRRLQQMQTPVEQIDWEQRVKTVHPALLHDDVTLIAGRRKG